MNNFPHAGLSGCGTALIPPEGRCCQQTNLSHHSDGLVGNTFVITFYLDIFLLMKLHHLYVDLHAGRGGRDLHRADLGFYGSLTDISCFPKRDCVVMRARCHLATIHTQQKAYGGEDGRNQTGQG